MLKLSQKVIYTIAFVYKELDYPVGYAWLLKMCFTAKKRCLFRHWMLFH